MLTEYNKENPTFDDVLKFTYDPEVLEIINSQHNKVGDGLVLFKSNINSKDYLYELEHPGYVRDSIIVKEDNLKKLFNSYIDKILEQNWLLVVQRASDILLNGLVSKNGIYITSDRFRHIQVKSLYDLSLIYSIEIKTEDVTISEIIHHIEPYIRDLFLSIPEYFVS